MYSSVERMVFHFDSSRGTNHQQAIEFSAKLFRYFGLANYGCFSEPMCLQQSNGYDCGIHVICNAENIAEYATRNHKIEGCLPLSQDLVLNKRANMLNLISELTRG